jgi:eukaryotic-like serine/threonine-protein kinase
MATMSTLPDRIGPYDIIQLLGEGGMGVVYEAEETAPVRRRVALKLVRSGLGDARDVLARFDAERRAIAVMNHPGIARVLHAGSTEHGEPYFAMELVRGPALTEFCDARRLAVRDRLQLFISICEAVQHAHQKGVIHRDLKPSNILVTDEEGQPQPKIIDFGIAKALGPQTAEGMAKTMAGFAMGTVAYMSPEQASATAIDVDTRADIYSLGVMLYELLVGQLPIDPVEIGVYEFLARLASGDTSPPTPSVGLSTAVQRSDQVAIRRRTDLRHLQQELRGDLDWIVMKAMHPDRSLRYETANALAADIRRHLHHEPVAARPPSTRYRVEKFIRRHKVGVITAVVASALVVTSAVVATVGFVQARRAEQVAAREAEAARQVTDFLVDLFRQSDPNASTRGTLTAREILERGSRRVSSELAAQPLLRARIMQAMGTVQTALGQYPEARSLLENVLGTREQALPTNDPLIAETLTSLGEVERDYGDFDAADQYLTRALAMRERVHGREHIDYASTLSVLATVRWRQGRYAEAESLFKLLLVVDARVRAPSDPRTARDMRGLAGVYIRTQRFEAADSVLRETLALQERTLGAQHPDVAATLNNLGTVAFYLARYNDALRYYQRALPMIERAYGPDHTSTVSVINNEAEVLWKLGQFTQSEPLFRRALMVKERSLAPDNPAIAVTLHSFACMLRDAGRFEEAEPLFRRALAIREVSLGVTHPDVGVTLRDYAALLRRANRANEAIRLESRAAGIN